MAKFKQDFSAKLNDLDGNPVRVGMPGEMAAALNTLFEYVEGEEKKIECGKKVDEVLGKEQTLASACVGALLGAYEDEKSLGEQERVRRYELSRRINKGGEQTFNTEERDLMKKLVGKRFPGCLVAPTVWEMLEDAPKVVALAEAAAP